MHPRDGRVVSNFIVQALTNEKLTLYGDGQQTRSFCYIDDLINGLIKLMGSQYTKPMNLGNPEEFKIVELANIIRSKINPNLSVQKMKLPEDDPLQRKPDIELAFKELNWFPTIKLSEGIDKTIDYFKENTYEI